MREVGAPTLYQRSDSACSVSLYHLQVTMSSHALNLKPFYYSIGRWKSSLSLVLGRPLPRNCAGVAFSLTVRTPLAPSAGLGVQQ